MRPRLGMLLAMLSYMPLPAQAAPGGPLTSIDLRKAFDTRSAWRFTASQGPDRPDPIGGGDAVPGVVRLCISADDDRTCLPALDRLLLPASGPDLFSEAHQLDQARIVDAGGVKLLLLTVSSMRSGDGDRRIATVALAYDRAGDRFVSVYGKQTNGNNNQEVRFIETGKLSGAMLAVEPTGDAPFGYRVTVSRMKDGHFVPVLRYRSATRYGDGNPLAVIDAEMPDTEQRLGLWHPGMMLPLPTGACPDPHLLRGALWCATTDTR